MDVDVWVKKKALPLFGQVDGLVLDIDGVILDVTASFRVAISKTVQYYLTQILDFKDDEVAVSSGETQLFKLAGGFNNDWELTYGVVLFYLTQSALLGSKSLRAIRDAGESLPKFTQEVGQEGEGLTGLGKVLLGKLDSSVSQRVLGSWDQDLIRQIFQEHYGGTDYCLRLYGFEPKFVKEKGLLNQEKVLISRDKLTFFSPQVGILTGRTEEETELALEKAGIKDLVPRGQIIWDSGGATKPDPKLLQLLVNKMKIKGGVYVGDTPDDLQTVKNFDSLDGEVFFLSAIVARKRDEIRFYQQKRADLVGLRTKEVMSSIIKLKEESYGSAGRLN